MGVHKQSVSFTDTAFAFARELVESGEYPNISAAVSGEMARARATRERERILFEVEVQRRLALPLDAWEPVKVTESFTKDARTHLARRAQMGNGDAT
jgi:antitoxin ParD1/3/4